MQMQGSNRRVSNVSAAPPIADCRDEAQWVGINVGSLVSCCFHFFYVTMSISYDSRKCKYEHHDNCRPKYTKSSQFESVRGFFRMPGLDPRLD